MKGWIVYSDNIQENQKTTKAYTKVEIPNCQDHYYMVTMLQKEP